MNDLHLYIQPQLDYMMDELIFKGYTASDLQAPLININWWWNESPYDKEIIDCDGLSGTFMNVLRMVELTTGSDIAFNLYLIEQLRSTIESRWEIKQKLAQEDYMDNYQHELQEVVGL